MNQAIPGTQSVVRSATILKLVLHADELGLSMSEVISHTALNRTTAFRILRALEAEGLLEQSQRDSRFRIGPELRQLARRAGAEERDFAQIAQPVLERLAHECQETVSLERLERNRVLVIGGAIGPRVLSTLPCVGADWPLHATASGKVLLAAMSREARQDLVRDSLEALMPQTITSLQDLEDELEVTAKRGYALNLEEMEHSYFAVAVPIQQENHPPLAVLALGGPKGRLTTQLLVERVPILQQAATEILQAWNER